MGSVPSERGTGRKLIPVGRSMRVLLLSDSENDSPLIAGELRKGGFDPSVDRIDTLEALGSALASDEWDVVISDYSLRRFGALKEIGRASCRERV